MHGLSYIMVISSQKDSFLDYNGHNDNDEYILGLLTEKLDL